jgi:hypothetical protein
MKMRKLNEGSVEKVVQKGDFLYFITKDDRVKPLEAQCTNISS